MLLIKYEQLKLFCSLQRSLHFPREDFEVPSVRRLTRLSTKTKLLIIAHL